jgi:hypothetical protein
MKNGDILYSYQWCKGWSKIILRPYRFRFDPVPGIHKDKWSFSNVYRKPRYKNERKQWYADKKFVRAKRRPIRLPNDWNDRVRSDVYNNKSWKKNKKVRKQWMKK